MVANSYVLLGFGFVSLVATVLMLLEDLFGHNIHRFNWLWLAAFCVLAVEFANAVACRKDAGESEFLVPQSGCA
jgi:hypothetical protein